MGVSLLQKSGRPPFPNRKEVMEQEAKAREVCDCMGGPTYIVAGKKLRCSQCGELLVWNPVKEEDDGRREESGREEDTSR